MNLLALAGFGEGPPGLFTLIMLLAAGVWPITLMLAGGWSTLAGIGVFVVDAVPAFFAGRWIARLQRRVGVPDMFAGFGVITGAFAVCIIINSIIIALVVWFGLPRV